MCSAASSRKPDLSDFNREELISSRNRKFGDGLLCVQIKQLLPITAGPICLSFSWPLSHVPGSRHCFCIQGRGKMGQEEGKVTPVSPVSFCHGSKSSPDLAPSQKDFCLSLSAQNQVPWKLPVQEGVWNRGWQAAAANKFETVLAPKKGSLGTSSHATVFLVHAAVTKSCVACYRL